MPHYSGAQVGLCTADLKTTLTQTPWTHVGPASSKHITDYTQKFAVGAQKDRLHEHVIPDPEDASKLRFLGVDKDRPFFFVRASRDTISKAQFQSLRTPGQETVERQEEVTQPSRDVVTNEPATCPSFMELDSETAKLTRGPRTSLPNRFRASSSQRPIVKPESLCIVVELDSDCFVKLPNNLERPGVRDRVLDLKIDIFINGDFQGSQNLPARLKKSDHWTKKPYYFHGRRIDRLIEKPWVLVPLGQNADGSMRGLKRTKGGEAGTHQRYDTINKRLRDYANALGKNHDTLTILGQYLTEVASLPAPEELQRPGGLKFGVIDIVISLGKGLKNHASDKYLVQPEGNSLSPLNIMYRESTFPSVQNKHNGTKVSQSKPSLARSTSMVVRKGVELSEPRLPTITTVPTMPSSPLVVSSRSYNTESSDLATNCPSSSDAIPNAQEDCNTFSQELDLSVAHSSDAQKPTVKTSIQASEPGSDTRASFTIQSQGGFNQVKNDLSSADLTREQKRTRGLQKELAQLYTGNGTEHPNKRQNMAQSRKDDTAGPSSAATSSIPRRGRQSTSRASLPTSLISMTPSISRLPSQNRPLQRSNSNKAQQYNERSRQTFNGKEALNWTMGLTESEQIALVQQEAAEGCDDRSRRTRYQLAAPDAYTPSQGSAATSKKRKRKVSEVVGEKDTGADPRADEDQATDEPTRSLLITLNFKDQTMLSKLTLPGDGQPTQSLVLRGEDDSVEPPEDVLDSVLKADGDKKSRTKGQGHRDRSKYQNAAYKPPIWEPPALSEDCIITYAKDEIRQIPSERGGAFQEFGILFGVRYILS